MTCDPEVSTVVRKAEDSFIILACDGIWDCLTSEDCVSQTRQAMNNLGNNQPLTSVIENMFDRIIATDILSSQGLGTDNMTCIIVSLNKLTK